MCGIFGVTTYKTKPDYNLFYESLKLLERRGPDDSNILIRKNCCLGHNRLAIIDPLNGVQPMSYNNYTIIYNGELYNTPELRKILEENDFKLDGTSDTEVLLKMFVLYKEKCLDYLNGIFAFAIYYDNKVFLARDQFGVKPLFYYLDDDLVFSSEIKAILKYKKLNTISIEGLREVLGMGPSHSMGKTPYDGVLELEPGTYLEYDGKANISRYFDVSAYSNKDTYQEAVKKIHYLVTKSIKSQLVSDVGISSFLSGGLDSSIIAKVSSDNINDLDTYSIDYENNDFESNSFQVSKDNDYIKYMVEEIKSNHHYITVSNDELVKLIDDALYAKDYPGMVDIDASLIFLASNIKKDHKVSLSGECADEIFGGYPWFYRYDKYDSFPWLRNLEFRESLLNNYWKEKLKLKEYVNNEYQRAIKLTPKLNMDNEKAIKEREMMYLNIKYFMTNLLDRKDRMTMSQSLEVRVPFCDKDLINYLYNIPMSYKYRNNVEKKILRDAFRNELPDIIVNRKKNPYPKSHNVVYYEIMKKKLFEALDNDSIIKELFNMEKISKMLKDDDFEVPWYGQLMTKPQFVAYLYQIDKWFKVYNLKISKEKA